MENHHYQAADTGCSLKFVVRLVHVLQEVAIEHCFTVLIVSHCHIQLKVLFIGEKLLKKGGNFRRILSVSHKVAASKTENNA